MSLTLKKQHNGYLLAFGLCFLTAFFIFLPFLIIDKGFFLYCGDFNSQQIPFYTYCQNIIHQGGASWSWATDLGSSFVTSYSFYLLGSPAFWLSTLFPNSVVPFLMVPLLCLKFGVTGFAAFAWIKRYAKSQNLALIGAVLYCFSGFSVYDIFFNHFIEPVMLFPFLLWSMDAFFIDKKRGSFSILVALNLLNSFFFFAGQVVFCVIYFIVMVISKVYRVKLKDFFWFVGEALVGVMMGMVLALPTAMQLLYNPRTAQFTSGMGLVMYSKVQQYFAIISSLFLPPDPPYMPNIFTDGAIKWTSLSAYLPLCSFAGVLCYLRAKKSSAFGRILKVCLVMALVPILNSAFYCFNSSYYARWFYMPLLIMAACTVIAIGEVSFKQLNNAIWTVFGITGLYLIFAVLPVKDGETGTYSFGVADDSYRVLLTVLTALLGLFAFYIVLRFIKNRPRSIAVLLGCVMGFSVFYGIVHISIGKFPQWERDSAYKSQTYDDIQNLNEALPDDHFYRLDAYECYENMGLRLNKSCIQFFNSTINPNIMQFYPSVGVKRDVSSKPEISFYALRGLLSVEYVIMPHVSLTQFYSNTYTEDYVAVADTDQYTILQNKNYVPMGFTYDYYISQANYENIATVYRSHILMKCVVLSEEQIKNYSGSLKPLPQDEYGRIYYGDYLLDCNARRATAASSFVANNNGFSAQITLPKDNLVFFSIPYDKGFSAYVNGQKVEVENVSGGMLAIPAFEGKNNIQVVYHTPYFEMGLYITLAGACIWLLYVGGLIYFKYFKKSKSVADISAAANITNIEKEDE